MRRTMIGGLLALLFVLPSTGFVSTAHAQRHPDRDGRDWDGDGRDRDWGIDRDWNNRHRHMDDYWKRHWNWYNRSYRPYYNRYYNRYYTPGSSYYYTPGRTYYYNNYDRGYEGGVNIGPLQLRWR